MRMSPIIVLASYGTVHCFGHYEKGQEHALAL